MTTVDTLHLDDSLTSELVGEPTEGGTVLAERVRFGGIVFDNLTMFEAVGRVLSLARGSRPAIVVTPNVDHVMRLQEDWEFARIVQRAELVLADGMPIVLATRLLGKPLKARVTGADLVPEVCARAAREGLRVFFLGGAPGSAEAAMAKLQEQHPNLRSAGTFCPDYGFENDPVKNQEAIDIVRRSRADILFVGLGSPKQERWIVKHMDEFKVPVSVGVGVAFSFVAGHITRAPRWMQKLSLEWLHRLCKEPKRLWQRYLLRGPRFISVLFHEWLMAMPGAAQPGMPQSHPWTPPALPRGVRPAGIRLPMALQAMQAREAHL